MLIDIEKVMIRDRIRKDFGDIEELARDIAENGLINPPVVNKDYELLAGERRLRACKSLGWSQIEIRMMDTRDAEHELNVEISENDVRKGFSKSERVDYMKRLLRIEEAKAKERMSDGGKGCLKSDNLVRADDETAKHFDIGRDTMRKEMSIVDNKHLISVEDFKDWDEGRLSTNKAFQKVKQKLDESKRQIEELRNRKPEIREVVPDDYEDTKRRLRSAEYNSKRLADDYDRARKANQAQQKRIKELEAQIGTDKKLRDANLTINYFTSATNDYIQRYGGSVWAFAEIESVDDATKEGFIKAIKSLDAFAQQLINNLGGNLHE